MRGQIRGVFHAPKDRMLFAPGTKGGVGHKKAWGCGSPTFLEVFCFPGVCPLLFGFQNDDAEKFGETIATPPKRGVPTDPDSGAEWHASIPARRGSLSSVFIPAGRLGTAPQENWIDKRCWLGQ